MNKKLTTTMIATGLMCLALVGLLFPRENITIPEIGRYQIISHLSKVGDNGTVSVYTHIADTATGDVIHTKHLVYPNGDTAITVTKFPMLQLPFKYIDVVRTDKGIANTTEDM
jgi:hypothetical protein